MSKIPKWIEECRDEDARCYRVGLSPEPDECFRDGFNFALYLIDKVGLVESAKDYLEDTPYNKGTRDYESLELALHHWQNGIKGE